MAKKKKSDTLELTKELNGNVTKLPEDEQRNKVQNMFRRFRAAEFGMGARHSKWKMLDMFDRGEQWKDAALPPWIPKPVNNMLRYFRTLKRANLASAIPKANFTPIVNTYAEQVLNIQHAYDHVWESEKATRLVRRAVDRAIAQGTAIAYVYNDDSYIGGVYYEKDDPRNIMYQGNICMKVWPNTNFFPDPDAYRIKDAKYVETTELLQLSAIKKNKKFQDYVGKLKLQGIKGDQIDREMDADGAIFTRDNNPSTTNYGRLEGDEMATLHCHWERYMNDEGRWQLDCTYYLKNNDFILYRVEDIKPGKYPFAVLYWEEEEQDFWGMSLLEEVLENQKIVNKTDQTASIIGVLHQNPQKIVTRESGINAQEMAKFGTMPGRVWVSNIDATKAVHKIEPDDIPKGLFELNDRIKGDMKEMVGINEAYTGQSVGSLTTSTGVNSLIERATVRDKDKMIQIDDFVEDLSDLIASFILYSWQDKRPIMTINPDGTPHYGTYEPVDAITAENMEWRVKSDVYARAPITQAMKKQQADQLMQLQGQFQFNPPIIIPEEWIQLQDFENKEDILQRMQRDREVLEQQKAQDMANMIMQVAQQVAAAKAQGEPDQQVQQVALQQAQQLLQQKQQQDTKNGAIPLPQGQGAGTSMQEQPQAPQGTTGALAMQNMARGS